MNANRKSSLAKLLLLPLLLTPIFSLPPTAYALDETAVQLRAKVLKLIHEKNYNEAKKISSTALSMAGNNQTRKLRIYINLAEICSSQKNVSEMLKYLKLAEPIARATNDASAQTKITDLWADYYRTLLKNYAMGLPFREKSVQQISQLLDQTDPRLSIYEEQLAEEYKEKGLLSKSKAVEAIARNRTDEFIQNTQKILKKLWHPTKKTTSQNLVVYFDIQNDGTPVNIKIKKSSGSADFDQDGLSVIERARFNPLKIWEFDAEPINFEFTFNYNVDANWGSAIAQTNNRLTEAQTRRNTELEALRAKFSSRSADVAMSDMQTLYLQNRILDCYLTLNQIDVAKTFLADLEKRPQLSDSAKALLKGQSGLILLKENKIAEGENLLSEAANSQGFESLNNSELKTTILKAYGDLLYKQNKTAEANKIYQHIRELKLDNGKSEFPRVHDPYSGNSKNGRDTLENKKPQGLSEI